MKAVTITEVDINEFNVLLHKSINEVMNSYLQKSKKEQPLHLTRQETAKYFDVSLNCINDWCKKGILTPYKVGQRTYFKRSECESVLFNQPKRY